MDIQFIDERIANLVRVRDNCHCNSREGQYYRAITNALIDTYRMLRRQILESAVDGFFAGIQPCDCRQE